MRYYIGTSGYSYKEWKGHFYPEKIPAAEMLAFYGNKLTSVEINNTFYRLPRTSVMESWAAQVPDKFRFSVKASRRITHFKRLKDVHEENQYLLRTAAAMGEKLGVVLYQLPPNLKKDMERLQPFLDILPDRMHCAFEFRHESWFEDDVFEALRAHNCALCVADAGGDLEVPFVSTADWGYLRLRREKYTKPKLTQWMKDMAAQKWSEAFVFFKHEDEAAGPKMAARFIELTKNS